MQMHVRLRRRKRRETKNSYQRKQKTITTEKQTNRPTSQVDHDVQRGVVSRIQYLCVFLACAVRPVGIEELWPLVIFISERISS
jgi:hypothetical protein